MSLSLYLFLTISPSPGRLNGRKRDSPTESGTVTAAAGTHGSSQVLGSRVSRQLQLLTGKTSYGQVRVEGTQDSGLGSQSLARCPRIGHLTSPFFFHSSIYSFIEAELIYNKMYIKRTTCTLNIYTYVCIDMHIYICAFA